MVAVFGRDADAAPSYFIELVLEGDEVISIRDYRRVPYLAIDARYRL